VLAEQGYIRACVDGEVGRELLKRMWRRCEKEEGGRY
jgi:hypothetical protein